MRIIAHLDMDAFFAAVEERDNPRLRDKAIVVGADPEDGHGRGIVATANYKARVYGIHSAMPITRAWRLAEEGRKRGGIPVVFVSTSFHRYGATSHRIFDLLRAKIPQLEQTSVDEAYMDLSFCGSYEAAIALATELKEAIWKQEQLTCSIGLGPNKLVAKVASDFKKPAGFTVVRDEEKAAFFAALPLRKLPGIGPKTEEYFAKQGLRLVGDVTKFSIEELEEMLGKWGGDLYRKLRSESDSEVTTEAEDAKSIGEQETFHEDTRDAGVITACLTELAKSVLKSFQHEGFTSYRRIVFTVRFADFETKTKSHTLKNPANDFQTFEFEVLKLFLPFLDSRGNPHKKLIRLVGVRLEQLL